jgi:hypothetical protein
VRTDAIQDAHLSLVEEHRKLPAIDFQRPPGAIFGELRPREERSPDRRIFSFHAASLGADTTHQKRLSV